MAAKRFDVFLSYNPASWVWERVMLHLAREKSNVYRSRGAHQAGR